MNSWDDLAEIVTEFVTEAGEHLDRIELELVALERDGYDPQRVASVFRSTHTIKGTSGFLGFVTIERLTHAGEDLLVAIRDRQLDITPLHIDHLLTMVDMVRRHLNALDPKVPPPTPEQDPDLDDLIDELRHPLTARDPSWPSDPARNLPAIDPPSTTPHLDVDVDVTATVDRADSDRTEAGDRADSTHSPTTIRIDVGVLDQLMNLVGELVLTRNQLLGLGTNCNRELNQITQRLDVVTAQLQHHVSQARMQPIATAWSKLPRLVRDVARACGKDVTLTSVGADTELDKTLTEAIADPLIHLVRNAVDHGIEPPAQRAPKPSHGHIHLSAHHDAGVVVVTVSDDGRGIDREQVLNRAVTLGVLSGEQAATLTANEIDDLIFHPGLSTSTNSTEISGRGVGMDVVRTMVAAVGGTVSVTSVPGHGTTFRLQIPLTLAIIPALFVEQHHQRFAIPHVHLVELIRCDERTRPVAALGGGALVNLRGELLTVIDMGTQLDPHYSRPPDTGTLMVLAVGHQRFVLLVDEVHDTAEIVVKALPELVTNTMFAGATIDGTGSVVLILDIMAVARQLDDDQPLERHESEPAPTSNPPSDTTTMVIVADGPRHWAVPIANILRLEQLAPTDCQHSRTGVVTIVDGEVLTLFRFTPDGTLTPLTDDNRPSDPQPMVLTGHPRRGIVVDDLVDIVTVASSSDATSSDLIWKNQVVSVLASDMPAFEPLTGSGTTTAPSPESPAR